MEPETVRLLGQALQRVNRQLASLVEDPATTVEPHPAPFLQRYQIYRVLHRNPYHPVMFYVGFAPQQRALVLTDEPANYERLARADGLFIDKPEVAAAYAETYLEVTRNMSRLFYVVSSAEEIKFRPQLSDAESKAKETFLARYGEIVAAPAAHETARGYTVMAYAVREQALEKHTLAVRRQGQIEDEVSTLEGNLPLVYGM